MELCGGIHVKNTAEIWHFKIISEGAVAAGIRRIEAITSDAVKTHFASYENTLNEVKEALKNPQDILKAVQSLQEDNAKLSKQIEVFVKEKVKFMKAALTAEIQQINGIQFLAKQVDLDPNGAKDLAYELGTLGTNVFVVLATADPEVSGGKPTISCYISKELVNEKALNAGNVVRELGKFIQGGGGGQPFFATAGGKNSAGISEALEKAIDFVK
jgi:alanyl-tRNA synthetase